MAEKKPTLEYGKKPDSWPPFDTVFVCIAAVVVLGGLAIGILVLLLRLL